jgi:hypothetical protein
MNQDIFNDPIINGLVQEKKKCPGLSNYQKMLVGCFLDPFGHFPTFCGLLPLQV